MSDDLTPKDKKIVRLFTPDAENEVRSMYSGNPDLIEFSKMLGDAVDHARDNLNVSYFEAIGALEWIKDDLLKDMNEAN